MAVRQPLDSCELDCLPMAQRGCYVLLRPARTTDPPGAQKGGWTFLRVVSTAPGQTLDEALGWEIRRRDSTGATDFIAVGCESEAEVAWFAYRFIEHYHPLDGTAPPGPSVTG